LGGCVLADVGLFGELHIAKLPLGSNFCYVAQVDPDRFEAVDVADAKAHFVHRKIVL
jgi:hypothetical protein